VVSPALRNILLTPFDREMRLKGYPLTRYADDWVITCKSAAEARAAVDAARRILKQLGVELYPQKTRIGHASRPSTTCKAFGCPTPCLPRRANHRSRWLGVDCRIAWSMSLSQKLQQRKSCQGAGQRGKLQRRAHRKDTFGPTECLSNSCYGPSD